MLKTRAQEVREIFYVIPHHPLNVHWNSTALQNARFKLSLIKQQYKAYSVLPVWIILSIFPVGLAYLYKQLASKVETLTLNLQTFLGKKMFSKALKMAYTSWDERVEEYEW